MSIRCSGNMLSEPWTSALAPLFRLSGVMSHYILNKGPVSTVADRIRFQIRSYEIYGGWSEIGVSFLRVPLFFLPVLFHELYHIY
jgi:hypothetical protein